MAILKVSRMGHPLLRAKAQAVLPADIKSVRIQQLIDDMFETMQEYQGVGLAAPQVHQGLRLFVALLDEDPGPRSEASVIVNPEIIANGDSKVEGWEGCLSIPDIRGRVPRAREIEVKAYDRKGRRISMLARNFTARVIQHETDHLDGVLFFDRMKSMDSLTYLEEYSRYHAKDDD